MTVAKVALETLALALRTDLTHADRHAKALSRWTVAAPIRDETYVAATLLHHLYSAIEAVAERSLKVFDGDIPAGEANHKQLLRQASSAVEGIRGPVLPSDVVIDKLRRFRHRFRKRYEDDLEPAHLSPLIKDTVAAWPRIQAHIAGFAAFVDECARVAR
jgi:hypothetical protein